MSATPAIEGGTLLLVVGPSGAGKDTIIAIAQDLLAARADVVFPRRIVTRAPSAAETNGQLSSDAFDEAIRHRAFAVWWQAHGHSYGLPASIDDDIRAGATVVCNVSRAIVPELRRKYRQCAVVLVDAPRDIRAARIAARRRSSDGEVATRLDRPSLNAHALAPDLVIMNVGDARDGGRRLAEMILLLVSTLASDDPVLA
jgi:ribose 1,5-bisphosphokinase